MKPEAIGKVLAAGFGDRVLSGIIAGALDAVTPQRCYEYIKDNIEVLHWASDSDWQKFRRMAKGANIGDVTSEEVIRAEEGESRYFGDYIKSS